MKLFFLAFLRLRKQDFEGTLKWLSRIPNPSANLVTKQQGYYHYLHGVIESQTNLTKAEKSFRKALSFGLSMSADEAMAKLSLAGILMQKRRKRRPLHCSMRLKKRYSQCFGTTNQVDATAKRKSKVLLLARQYDIIFSIYC